MLLTGGQVSVALSSVVVIFCTAALFIAGYVLQQQTVQSLHETIKPRLPSPHANAAHPGEKILGPRTKASRKLFGQQNDSPRSTLLKRPPGPVDVNWYRLAYLQVVKSHAELCSAVMLFEELNRLKSPAQRVLLFPTQWVTRETEGGTASDDEGEAAQIYTTRRLLRRAARRFRVNLVPSAPMKTGTDETDPASYSLSPAFSLLDYDRLIVLPPSGTLLSAAPMDSLLAFAELEAAVTTIGAGADANRPAFPLVIQPAKADYTHLTTVLKEASSPMSDSLFLETCFSSIPDLPATDKGDNAGAHLFTTTSSLTAFPVTVEESSSEFNATHFMKHTSYVKLQDEGLPGPEFDVPRAKMEGAAPRNEAARRVWERLYEGFQARRQEVCGLELEPWRDGAQAGQADREL